MNAGTLIHASCVAFGPDRGILILGPSGAGKSALALMLMGLSATLVADDQTSVRAEAGQLMATAPASITGMIEARGIGVLRVQPLATARVVLAIDLGVIETSRLPPERQWTINGIVLPLLHKVEGGHFPAAILHYVCGRSAG